jgi:hypothetical protein
MLKPARFNVAEIDGAPVYGHGGGAAGMNGKFCIYPTLGEVVVTWPTSTRR